MWGLALSSSRPHNPQHLSCLAQALPFPASTTATAELLRPGTVQSLRQRAPTAWYQAAGLSHREHQAQEARVPSAHYGCAHPVPEPSEPLHRGLQHVPIWDLGLGDPWVGLWVGPTGPHWPISFSPATDHSSVFPEGVVARSGSLKWLDSLCLQEYLSEGA